MKTHVSPCCPFTRRNLRFGFSPCWIAQVDICPTEKKPLQECPFHSECGFLSVSTVGGLFRSIFNQCCWFSLEKFQYLSVENDKKKIQVLLSWIDKLRYVCDWIQTVPIPIIPSPLLSSRPFISFPFCWFWFTLGSQRAPSKGGEPLPQGTRWVRSNICSLWRIEMIWNLSWLPHCLGFTESHLKGGGLRAHVCDCVVSAWLRITPSLTHSVLHLPSCYFCLMSQVDPHCDLRRLCVHSPHKTLCGDSGFGPIADWVYPQQQ